MECKALDLQWRATLHPLDEIDRSVCEHSWRRNETYLRTLYRYSERGVGDADWLQSRIEMAEAEQDALEFALGFDD
jgi:hypothetical protein